MDCAGYDTAAKKCCHIPVDAFAALDPIDDLSRATTPAWAEKENLSKRPRVVIADSGTR
jgi:hypothetical protein